MTLQGQVGQRGVLFEWVSEWMIQWTIKWMKKFVGAGLGMKEHWNLQFSLKWSLPNKDLLPQGIKVNKSK